MLLSQADGYWCCENYYGPGCFVINTRITTVAFDFQVYDTKTIYICIPTTTFRKGIAFGCKKHFNDLS